ncbi:MAG: hypothetical protein GXP49_05895 [Deltaproteobacteria bacterium]|nr:hypothetical protein [Deltaproteobacteria bacterium]
MVKKIFFLGAISILGTMLAPVPALAGKPDMSALIDKTLYGALDQAIGFNIDQNNTDKRLQITLDDGNGSQTQYQSGNIRNYTNIEPTATQKHRDFRSLIRVLHSLPFKTRQEQINDLLATVHTLHV